MNKLLLESIKIVMVYYRNKPEDKGLKEVVLAAKTSITTGNNIIFLETLKKNSKEAFGLLEALKKDLPDVLKGIFLEISLNEDVKYSGRKCQKIEYFMCNSLDIMLTAYSHNKTGLVCDIADMLQGIPDLEYWKMAKSIYRYYKVYVKPVAKKYNLDLKI